jgi:pimeloyl-ACP methyl ester carboxylesterase
MAHGGFWDAQAKLADTHQLIVPDLRGHGQSRADLQSLSIARLARDMQELADQLDLHDAVVVGWSLGAAVAWPLLAGPAAARFAGCVVVDMTPRILNDGDWLLGLSPELIAARTAAFRGDFESFTATAGQAVLAPPLTGEKARLAAWASAEFARNDPAAMAALWDSLAEEDHRPLLPRIAQPSLIVRGAHSYLYGPETARFLERSLPDARTIEFSRSGHAPNLEEPELFNSTISDFTAGLQPARQVEHARGEM